jgi:hypothetical protein
MILSGVIGRGGLNSYGWSLRSKLYKNYMENYKKAALSFAICIVFKIF